VYAAWVIWLGVCTTKLTCDWGAPLLPRVETLVLFMIFFALQFTGVFTPFNYGCILAVAIMEKHFVSQEVVDGPN